METNTKITQNKVPDPIKVPGSFNKFKASDVVDVLKTVIAKGTNVEKVVKCVKGAGLPPELAFKSAELAGRAVLRLCGNRIIAISSDPEKFIKKHQWEEKEKKQEADAISATEHWNEVSALSKKMNGDRVCSYTNDGIVDQYIISSLIAVRREQCEQQTYKFGAISEIAKVEKEFGWHNPVEIARLVLPYESEMRNGIELRALAQVDPDKADEFCKNAEETRKSLDMLLSVEDNIRTIEKADRRIAELEEEGKSENLRQKAEKTIKEAKEAEEAEEAYRREQKRQIRREQQRRIQ
ncbi:MAG: hypothetical protein LBR91_03450 [Puniceicoccales bacterium]|nr:hypothetical protein [Puniceicoccales bacterium]